jgi:hypothetical protein
MKLNKKWLALSVVLTGLAFTTLIPEVSIAQNASECGFIQNSDQRSMCRAIANRNVSECGFIQNSDLRSMCRAQVGRNPSECGFIQNSDFRAQCRALSGG